MTRWQLPDRLAAMTRYTVLFAVLGPPGSFQARFDETEIAGEVDIALQGGKVRQQIAVAVSASLRRARRRAL
jgi:hypothetical protein